MKSKIDEVIEMVDMLNLNISFRKHIDLKTTIKEELEQLRPYVEFYDSVELWSTGKDLLLFKIERKLFNKIKRQIKEQKDDREN